MKLDNGPKETNLCLRKISFSFFTGLLFVKKNCASLLKMNFGKQPFLESRSLFDLSMYKLVRV